MPPLIDLFGYLACALVLLTFCFSDALYLRLTALSSNVCFLAYAAVAELPHIGLLHTLLLGINLGHVFRGLRRGDRFGRHLRGAPRAGARACDWPPARRGAPGQPVLPRRTHHRVHMPPVTPVETDPEGV